VESVISGATELVRRGHVQLAITPHVPTGWLGDHLIRLEFACVASPDHPLHHLGREVADRDLRQYRQVVVRDSGERRDTDVSWLVSERRLTVSTMGTRIQALCQGLGFAWSPMLKIRRELNDGLLKPLPLEHGSRQYADLYMIITDAEGAGPATLALAGMIRKQVKAACAELAGVT
jgi:DNA-binding transcriptional LysR family regulator